MLHAVVGNAGDANRCTSEGASQARVKCLFLSRLWLGGEMQGDSRTASRTHVRPSPLEKSVRYQFYGPLVIGFWFSMLNGLLLKTIVVDSRAFREVCMCRPREDLAFVEVGGEVFFRRVDGWMDGLHVYSRCFGCDVRNPSSEMPCLRDVCVEGC